MLHMLSKLSKIFQNKLVDISSIGSIVKTKIASIRMYFLIDSCDLNQDTFNPSTYFHVILEFGPVGGYFCRLPIEIQGSKFHSIQMTRDPSKADLEVALSFQRCYAKVVCEALFARFDDNNFIDAFRLLNPIHMLQRQVDLILWSIVQLDILLQ